MCSTGARRRRAPLDLPIRSERPSARPGRPLPDADRRSVGARRGQAGCRWQSPLALCRVSASSSSPRRERRETLRAAGLQVGDVARSRTPKRTSRPVVDLVRRGRCDLVDNKPRRGSGARGRRPHPRVRRSSPRAVRTMIVSALRLRACYRERRAEPALSLQERIGIEVSRGVSARARTPVDTVSLGGTGPLRAERLAVSRPRVVGTIRSLEMGRGGLEPGIPGRSPSCSRRRHRSPRPMSLCVRRNGSGSSCLPRLTLSGP